MSLTNAAELAIGQGLFNGTSFAIGSLQLGLLTAASESAHTEVTTGVYSTYARQTITGSEASSVWTIKNSSDANAAIEFPALASGDTGVTATHWGLFDASNNLYVYGEITGNLVLTAGQVPTVAANSLTVTFN